MINLKTLSEVYTPEKEIKFKNDIIVFNDFTNVFRNTYKEIPLNSLTAQHFINTTIQKKQDGHLISFQKLIKEKIINDVSPRCLENTFYPCNFMIDIDIKEKQVFEQLKKDTGINFQDINEAIKYIYDCLYTLKDYILYLDYSFSGKGVKGIMTIVNNLYVDSVREYENRTLSMKNTDEHIELINTIQSYNSDLYLNILKDFKLFYHTELYNEKKEKINYIDLTASKTLTTGTFQSKGSRIWFNPDYHILFNEIDVNKQNKKLFNKTNKSYQNNINGNKLAELNNKWFEHFKNHNVTESEKKVFEDLMKELFTNYNGGKGLALLFSLKYSNDEVRQQFYKWFKKYNRSNSSGWKGINKDYNTFNNYLNKLKPKNNKTGSLQDIFRFVLKIETTINFKDGCDFFGFKYDEILKYDNFIDEKEKELKEIIKKNKKIVINSKAGSGKSTELTKLLVQAANDNTDGLIVFCSPKNALLKQLKHIINTDYPNLTVYKHCEEHKVNINNLSQQGIILSSTPKLSYLNKVKIKMLVVDEIHELVSYGKKIASNLPKAQRLILLSATPESYLIGESGYYYLKFEKNISVKKDLNLLLTNNIKKSIDNMIDKNKKQLIFYNNIKNSKQLSNYFGEKGIKFELLNAKEKTKHSEQILIKQKLEYNMYMVTNYVNAGINFLNEKWDDVIIIDNDNTTVFDTYQMTERFRKSNPNITYIRKKKRTLGRVLDLTFDLKKLNDEYKKAIQITDLLNHNYSINKYNDLSSNDNLVKNDRYLVNRDGLKKDMLEEVFLEKYRIYDDVCADSLGYYFNVEIKNENYEDKIKTVHNNDELLKFWVENHSIIINQPHSIKDKIYLDNLWFFNNKLRDCELVYKFKMKIQDTFGTDSLFQKRLKRAEKNIIGNENDIVGLTGKQQEKRKLIDLIRHEIQYNIEPFLIHTKKGFLYKVKDILVYYKQSKTAYNYQDYEGKCIIKNLTEKGFSMFLADYFVKPFQIMVDGERNLVVYLEEPNLNYNDKKIFFKIEK